MDAPTSGDNIGQLSMLDDGSWAYVSKEVLPADGGDLVVFADTDGRESHLFVVQATYGWGALLHRLDRQPISETLRGSFAKTEACYGTGPTSACVDSAPKGTVFSVFAANNGRLLLQDGHPRRVARLRSQDPASSVWAAPAAEWIAVKDAVLGQTPVFRLGDEGCSLTMPGVSKLTLPSSHPLNVEQAAYDSLVDGFVRCADGEVRVRIPSATRATLPSRDPRLRTHPVLSIMADRVEGDPETVARLVGYIGVGDFDAAGLFLLQLAAANPTLGLHGAEVLAAVGRPEEALRLAFTATQTSWNRDGDFFWVYLRARVALELGDEAGFVERWGRLPEMANKLQNTAVHGWLVWQAFEAETAHAVTYRTYDEALPGDDFVLWRAMLRLSAALNHNDPKGLASYLRLAPKARLGFENPDGIAVAAKDGPLDVYGRMWAGGADAELSTIGFSAYRPGFEKRAGGDLREQMLLNQVLGRTTSPAQVVAGSSCDGARPDLLPLGPDGAAIWAATTGAAMACEGIDALLTASQQVAPELEVEPYVAALVSWRLSHVKDARSLTQAVSYAQATRLGEVCSLWTLALAYSQLISDHVEDAEKTLAGIGACSERGFVVSEKRLAAAIAWMRTGRVSLDFDAGARADVQKVARMSTDICALVTPWEVDLRNLTEPDVANLVVAIGDEKPTNFKVVSALGHIKESQQSLATFQQALTAGNSVEAAKALLAAKQQARAAGHLPLVQYIQLFESVIYASDASKFAVAPESGKPKTPAQFLRMGRLDVQKGWDEPTMFVARLLGQPLGPLPVTVAIPAALQGLCAAPEAPKSDGNIDIDAL